MRIYWKDSVNEAHCEETEQVFVLHLINPITGRFVQGMYACNVGTFVSRDTQETQDWNNYVYQLMRNNYVELVNVDVIDDDFNCEEVSVEGWEEMSEEDRSEISTSEIDSYKYYCDSKGEL